MFDNKFETKSKTRPGKNEKHPKIEKVYWPGFEEHPNHEVAKSQMKDFGGMLSFNLALGLDTKKFLMGFEMIKPTMSLAGVESTVLSPRLTSHALLSEEERQAQGINEQMVRFSAGIEAVEDIKNDIIQSISKIIMITKNENRMQNPIILACVFEVLFVFKSNPLRLTAFSNAATALNKSS